MTREWLLKQPCKNMPFPSLHSRLGSWMKGRKGPGPKYFHEAEIGTV